MKIQNVAYWMIVLTLVVLTLIYGQSIILPFIIALFIWFVVKKIRNFMDRSTLLRRFIPKWIKTLLASFVVFHLIVMIGQVLTTNIESLSNSYVRYLENIELISVKVNEIVKINVHDEMTHLIGQFEFGNYLQSLFNSISELLSDLVMIIFYVVFLFVEESLFDHKIRLIFKNDRQHEGVRAIIQKVDSSMSSYISLKSLVSLLTTLLSYFILLAVGIDAPLFWAFLIFMFNFIPSVGPILGTVFPAIFSLLQFGEFFPFFVLLIGVGGVSMLVGSLVEPKLMGNTLNISPLVAIASLAIWGSIWGILGMLLSVPITVALIIILSQFSQTRAVAILLSEKGRIS